MPWVKIDDDFYQHPKLRAVGPLGLAMQVAGLCYANHNQTRGFIPITAVSTLLDLSDVAIPVHPEADDGKTDVAIGLPFITASRANCFAIASLLVCHRIWTRIESDDRNGYEIHDYRKYQNPEVEKSAVRAKAGRRGAAARWHGKTAVANANANGKPMAKHSPVPVPDPVPLKNVPQPQQLVDNDGSTSRSPYMRAVIDTWDWAGETFYAGYARIEVEYGGELALAAFLEAQRNAQPRPTVRYLEAICERCKKEGVMPGATKTKEAKDAKPTETDTHRIVGWMGNEPILGDRLPREC